LGSIRIVNDGLNAVVINVWETLTPESPGENVERYDLAPGETSQSIEIRSWQRGVTIMEAVPREGKPSSDSAGRDPMNTHETLALLVSRVRCKPGWSFRLVEEDGAKRLVISVLGWDSSAPNHLTRHPSMTVRHFFPVPEATYNEKTWRRWIFEQCRRLENHELGEWFRDGAERSFQPLHGPGEDPYTIHEFRPEIDGLTTQDGSVREPYGEDR